MATAILFLKMFLAAHPVSAPAQAAVTFLDLSGPSEPESEFPMIASKGKL